MDGDAREAELCELEERFRRAYDDHALLVKQLERAPLKPGEAKSLKKVTRVRRDGLASALRRLRSDDSRADLLALVEQFCGLGPTVVLQVGAQRGGDFLLNQLRGQWAEKVCCSIAWSGHKIVAYGPSGAAMPGEEDHEKTIRAFREIVLTEGKRPDLVAFSEACWKELDAAVREQIAEWPNRRLRPDEEELLKRCRCGIEVKNSTWHYARRRAAGGGPLAVTVKDEELEDIEGWTRRFGQPVLFMQVLFDEVYCMSFRRMQDAIRRGMVYADGDYVAEKDRKSQKYYHRFFLADERHLCAKTVFPSESEAIVSILPNGNVIPYIRYRPVESCDARPEVIEGELAY